MSFTNPLPTPTPLSGSTTHSQVYDALQAKYNDAAEWAKWAGTILEEQALGISNTFSTNTVASAIVSLTNAISSVPAYVSDSTTVNNDAFNNQLLTDLQARLIADVAAYNTGLGSTVEAAMFARVTARVNSERLATYTEVTNGMSALGYEQPPGALLAKQSEMNNKTSEVLADANASILHESAVLAQSYNIEMLKLSEQLVAVLGQIHDSEKLRNFELKKIKVMENLEAYKNILMQAQIKGDLLAKEAQLSIEASNRNTALEVESFRGIAQAAAQMVASALNGVNVSSSINFSGSESTDRTKGVVSKTIAEYYQMAGSLAGGVSDLPELTDSTPTAT